MRMIFLTMHYKAASCSKQTTVHYWGVKSRRIEVHIIFFIFTCLNCPSLSHFENPKLLCLEFLRKIEITVGYIVILWQFCLKCLWTPCKMTTALKDCSFLMDKPSNLILMLFVNVNLQHSTDFRQNNVSIVLEAT